MSKFLILGLERDFRVRGKKKKKMHNPKSANVGKWSVARKDARQREIADTRRYRDDLAAARFSLTRNRF